MIRAWRLAPCTWCICAALDAPSRAFARRCGQFDRPRRRALGARATMRTRALLAWTVWAAVCVLCIPIVSPSTVTLTATSLGSAPLHTASNTVSLAVEFNTTVTGLDARDFDITTDSMGVARALTGSGSSYVLVLTISSNPASGVCTDVCPGGYTASDTDPLHCAATSPSGTRATANEACSPYTLTSVTSAAHNTFITNVAGGSQSW